MDPHACDRCGAEVPSTARFCPTCGAPQPVHEANPTSTLPIIGDDDGTPVLVVTRGANAGSKFALDQPVTTIGRHPRSVIFLDDITVSRHHAEVTATATGFDIRDVGSLNGTYVNNKLIDSVSLVEGDQIQIGKYKLIFAIEVG